MANLADMAAALLEARLDRASARVTASEQADVATVNRLLEAAHQRIESVALRTVESSDEGVGEQIVLLIEAAACEMVASRRNGKEGSGALRGQLLAALAGSAEATRLQLEDLASFLAEAAGQLRSAVSLPGGNGQLAPNPRHGRGSSTADEIRNHAIPLPQVDESRLNKIPTLHCPRLWTAWPGMCKWLMRRRIERSAHAAMWSVLSDYRARLRTWLTDQLRRVTDSFESQIAIVRERTAAPEDDGGRSPIPAGQVRADIEVLRALLPRAPEPSTRLSSSV
jgi:hypothetical protein